MHLTPRETEACRLLLTNKTGPECAKEMGIHFRTFQMHAHWVYVVKGVSGRRELMAKELGK